MSEQKEKLIRAIDYYVIDVDEQEALKEGIKIISEESAGEVAKNLENFSGSKSLFKFLGKLEQVIEEALRRRKP